MLGITYDAPGDSTDTRFVLCPRRIRWFRGCARVSGWVGRRPGRFVGVCVYVRARVGVGVGVGGQVVCACSFLCACTACGITPAPVSVRVRARVL